MATIVLVLKCSQTWSLMLLMPAVLCLGGLIYCARKQAEIQPEFSHKLEQQKHYYLVLKNRKWRDVMGSTTVPDWRVVERWNKQRHYYALQENSEANELLEWEDPLEWPQVGAIVH